MADNVLERLAKKLKELPDEVEAAFMSSTKKAINEEGAALRKNLERGSQAATLIPEFTNKSMKIDEQKWEEAKRKLNDAIYDKQYETSTSYTYEVDWDDKKIVDEDLGIKWGRFKKIERRKGARNYSRAPATYHDLAFILSEGRAINFSSTGIKVVKGTKFIEKAMRRAKKWEKKRDIYCIAELDLIDFDKDKKK